jgi:hypothetical protein
MGEILRLAPQNDKTQSGMAAKSPGKDERLAVSLRISQAY